MQLPDFQPAASRSLDGIMTGAASRSMTAVTPQGCDYFACADAVRRCIANPDPVRCILDIAPNCIDCIRH